MVTCVGADGALLSTLTRPSAKPTTKTTTLMATDLDMFRCSRREGLVALEDAQALAGSRPRRCFDRS
jgi:hypothetical protein